MALCLFSTRTFIESAPDKSPAHGISAFSPIDRTDMDRQKLIIKPLLTAIAASILLTNGCALPHAPLRTNEFGNVSPRKYCPGDTVTANYDLVMDAPCTSRPGFDCATIGPAITISSTPTAFPPRTSTALIDSATFMPTEPRVDVTFSPPAGTASFIYPTTDPMTGAPGFQGRFIRNTTRPVERLEGEIMQALTHNGMCSGGMPIHSAGQIAGLPEFSPNLGIRQLCNTSAVAIEATLSGAAGEFQRRLSAGECFRLDEPGIPAGLGAARIVAVRSLTVDPTAQCNSLQDMTPPQSLSTSVVLACGI